MFFILEKVKETILDVSQGCMRVMHIYFALIYYQHKMTR